jgi:alpha-methylacyl-CoA racemase
VSAEGTGALAGLRIIEMAGLGPAPFCGMMLADHGAEVLRVARPGEAAGKRNILNRSRRSIAVDVKSEDGVRIVRALCRDADGLIEGFRPGVMERLGLGPDTLLADNPRLVYGRMTGWGQQGPLADTAGHDINYIALAGALDALGRAGEKPTAPINLVGDFGGGGMMLAFGMACAMLRAHRDGRGQVVDCAMVDGAALLMAMIWYFRAEGRWRDARGTNFLDSGAHFYDSYECADGRHVAIGAIEPQFYAALRDRLGLAGDPDFDPQFDPRRWPAMKARLAAIFRTRTRDEWCAVFEGSDACLAPVLGMGEAPAHPHNVARGTFVTANDIVQPAPAPRLSRTPARAPDMPGPPGGDTDAILASLGYPPEGIAALRDAGVVG